MPAKSPPEKDDGNGLLAATRFNAELSLHTSRTILSFLAQA